MTYSSEVLADSPLAYWRLGESSGTTMVDASGNSRNGTYGNSPTLGAVGLLSGDADTSVDFNGSNHYAQVADAAWLDVSTVTLEAVIRPDNVSSYRSILDRDVNGTPRVFQFRISNTGKIQLVFWTTTGGPYTVTGATTLVAGSTYHVAATYDGSTARLYLNGTQDGSLTQAGSFQVSTGYFSVGVNRSVASGAQWLDGRIDEVAYYGSALSSTRIAAHYAAATAIAAPVGSLAATLPKPTAAMSGTYTSPPPTPWSNAVAALSPWAWYRLADASGAPQDSSGNNRHGSTTGAKTYGRPSLVPSDTVDGAQANSGDSAWSSPALAVNTNTAGAGASVAFTYKGTGAGAGDKALARWSGVLALYGAHATFPNNLALNVNATRLVSSIANTAIWDAQPHLIGFSVADGAQSMWVDGVKVATGTVTFAFDLNTVVEIGSIGSSYHNGDYDEIVIANRVWSDAEWEALYDGWLGVDPAAPDGTLSATLPKPTVNLAGAYVPPPVSGALAATLPKPTLALAGTYLTDTAAGSLAATFPLPTLTLAGAYTAPAAAPSRTGFGMVLDSTATVSAEAPFAVEPDTVPLHVVTPTVPAPVLVNGRPS